MISKISLAANPLSFYISICMCYFYYTLCEIKSREETRVRHMRGEGVVPPGSQQCWVTSALAAELVVDFNHTPLGVKRGQCCDFER